MTYKKQVEKLKDECQNLEEDRRVLLNLSSALISFFETSVTPKSKQIAKKNGCHYFIPSSILDSIYWLKLVKQHLKKKDILEPKFLDAGCGIGNIILLANQLGFDADGIEIDNRNLRIGKAIASRQNYWSLNGIKITKGNILTFKHYSKYDVIYFYCPLSDHVKEVEFENKITDEIKVGAVIIARLAGYAFHDDKRFLRVKENYPIWVKTNG